MRVKASVWIIFIGLLLSVQTGFCQTGFKQLVNAAYDSSLLGSYPAAIKLLYQAKLLKGKDTAYNESINLYLGNNYEALGQIDSSIYYYGEALPSNEAKKDYAALSFLYNRLGSSAINFTRKYEQAIDYFNKQLNCCQQLQDSASLFDCYNNLGIAQKLMKQYAPALQYFDLVANHRSTFNQARSRAILFTADTYSLMKSYRQAIHFYTQAIDSFEQQQDSSYLFIAWLNKGDCLLQQERYDESLQSLLNAQQHLTSAVIDNDKKELYHNLADVNARMGRFQNAFFFKTLEARLKDSINTASIQQASANAEAKYELRRNQDSLTISRQQLHLASGEINQRQRNFIIALILAGGIALLALLALRNASLRKKANLKLAKEKQRVETLASELNEANEAKSKLFSIISHDLRSPISSLYALFKLQEIKMTDPNNNAAVSKQVNHLLETLEDMLVWSKTQLGRFTLQPVLVNVDELFDDLMKLYHDVAADGQVRMQNKSHAAQLTIRTDENLLKTILRNLLANAIHGAPQQSEVHISAIVATRGITCLVSNEGTASAFTELENRFHQMDMHNGAGGLGLYLVKELAAKLNATADLSYSAGRIYFKLYLPNLQR